MAKSFPNTQKCSDHQLHNQDVLNYSSSRTAALQQYFAKTLEGSQDHILQQTCTSALCHQTTPSQISLCMVPRRSERFQHFKEVCGGDLTLSSVQDTNGDP